MKIFTLQTSSLRCDSLLVDQYWTYNASPMPKVDCASIEIRGWDVWPLSNIFNGDLAVDTLKFNGDIDELNFDTGSFRVGNISFSGSVSKFRVSQNATLMTNSEILLNGNVINTLRKYPFKPEGLSNFLLRNRRSALRTKDHARRDELECDKLGLQRNCVVEVWNHFISKR